MSVDHRAKGAVLIEFLMVLPVFGFIAVIAAELGYALQMRQIIATLEREAAITSFKECSRITNPNSRRICLETVRTGIETTAKAALGCISVGEADNGTRPLCPEMILSVYELAGANVNRLSVVPAGATTSRGNPSGFSPADYRFLAGGSLRPLMQQHTRVVICEFYWNYRAAVPALRFILRFSLRTIYGATIV